MEPSKYAEQILNIYNYFDGAIIVDRRGTIEYYNNKRRDINTLTDEEILGRSLFDVYPEIRRQESTLMEVIRTGKPLINQHQRLSNYKAENYEAIFSTYPVLEGEKIIGAAEVFFYLQDRDAYLNISAIDSELKRRADSGALEDIVSASPSMEALKKAIMQVSQTDSNVLICGETGTGKDLAAQAVHTGSRRRSRRFLSQNCAAIPENLLESILFGTVRGGFTGAENRMGLFEAASGGTLFLDEVNSMDLAVQAKLLKAVEEQKITRVGGTEEIPVDVRVITAMNEDPWECTRSGRLREDLYFRLRVAELDIPPLRQRREDILPLAAHYIAFFNRTMGRRIEDLSEAVKRAFLQYSWPGNVRELRNMIESGFNLCEGRRIEMSDIDTDLLLSAETLESGADTAAGGLKQKLQAYENYIIKEVIKVQENQAQAAKILGISRQTLNSKLKNLIEKG